MNPMILQFLTQHLKPAAHAAGGAVGSLAAPCATPQYAVKKGLGMAMKSPAMPLLAAGALIPQAALEFDRSALKDQNTARWNEQQELGRNSEMGDFSKNSELRKLAVQHATEKTGGIMDSLQSAVMDPNNAEQFYGGASKALGAGVAGGVMGAAAMGIKSLINHLTQPSATTVLQHLMADDPIIKRADPKRVLESYISMKRFAPTLATDINATRSYLREALTVGSGPDFSTISNLAKAEKSVAGGGGGSHGKD